MTTPILNWAAKSACRGGYSHAGQTCISVQRIYVQKQVFQTFLVRFQQLVAALKVGDPLDENTDLGPMIDQGALEKTEQMVQEAIKGGAKLIAGGKKQPKNLLEPIILGNTKPDMRVIKEEIFGPVVAVMEYDHIDEAIAQVNASRYGLQAGVFTRNIDVAFKAARSIDVGGVMINDSSTFRADNMPYGGQRIWSWAGRGQICSS